MSGAGMQSKRVASVGTREADSRTNTNETRHAPPRVAGFLMPTRPVSVPRGKKLTRSTRGRPAGVANGVAERPHSFKRLRRMYTLSLYNIFPVFARYVRYA